MEELEKHLRALCSNDARLRLLEAQWEYDKRLVQQALQTVGNTFPHYSLHDASHSNTILLNVSRVLGDRVARLTATDTWLLLEAAYWHDVGMVVSDATLRQAWSSPEFAEHLQMLTRSDDGVLAYSANMILNRANLQALGNDWPLDVRQSLTFVAADYMRRQHQARSAEAVRHPAGFSIDSPRTLIPSRLFEWLARVCLGHGQQIDQVMLLPKIENGIGTDRCHPRFVAFMLRLGDLLDLDNGRFCPVLLSSVGAIPSSSLEHIGKHASIEHFYVGPDRIDVEAVCRPGSQAEADLEAYGSYQAISQWLGWLRSELTHLAINWTAVAPGDILGAPSIGRITSELAGYELIGDRFTPEFDVDSDHFLELSKSSGLFGAPQEAWQRELITNAVDATLIQIWNSSSEEVRQELEHGADPFKAVREIGADYPIEITIVPGEEPSIEGQDRKWTVSIRDRGCGLGSDDIRSLQVVGSSGKNRQRRVRVAEMPQELRPTGSFGLGFQSVFLEASEVELRTVHAVSGESRRIVLRRYAKSVSPSQAKRSGVYIQRLETKKRERSGTTISFELKRPAKFGIDVDDILLSRDSTPTATKWIEQLALMCGTLPIPVLVNGKELASYHASVTQFTYFDREQGMLVSLGGPDDKGQFVSRTAYRGAQVTHGSSTDGLLSTSVDLYSGVASDILQVSRSALTSHGEKEFSSRRDAAFPKAVDAYVKELRSGPSRSDDLLARASLLARSMTLPSSGDEWRELECLALLSTRLPAKLRALFEQQAAVLVVLDRRHAPRRIQRGGEIPGNAFIIGAAQEQQVKKLVAEEFSYIALTDVLGPVQTEAFASFLEVYSLSKTPSSESKVRERALQHVVTPRYPGRASILCADEYADLAVAAEHPSWSRIPEMLSPFRAHGEFFDATLSIRLDHPQEYIRYVLRCGVGASGGRRVERVVESAKRFIRFADSVYQADPTMRCEYDLEKTCRLFEEVAAEPPHT